MTTGEPDAIRPSDTEPAPAADVLSEDAEILREMDKLENQKPSWQNAAIILVISAVLFAGTGLFRESWQDAWMFIPVLLFHELGHLAAMRMFGYRNLRMFFIPFFGAAVTGRNLNVAGWKKAVVALMGPLPGIAVGSALAVVAFLTGQEWLAKVALLLLILNGFNLLPVLPFDGGWVLHAVLFCRHPLLDAGFRTVAAVALFLLGASFGDWILMFIAVVMALGLPTAFRMAQLADEFRRSGLVAPSAEQTTIPPDVAQVIARRVKQALPKGLNNRNIAQTSLSIFETLNARPPGWLASLALLFVHGMSFLMAVAFSVVTALALRPPP